MSNPAGSVTSAIDPTGARLATQTGGTTAYTIGDLHGNIAGQVNSAITTVLSALRYDPYGLAAPGGGSYDSGGSFTNPWRYQGRLDVSPDAANPLYDLSARFYSPWLGTFTSHDTYQGTATDPRSLNRFLYVEGNPTSLIDPTGHTWRQSDVDDDPVFSRDNNLVAGSDDNWLLDQALGLPTGTAKLIKAAVLPQATVTGTPEGPSPGPAPSPSETRTPIFTVPDDGRDWFSPILDAHSGGFCRSGSVSAGIGGMSYTICAIVDEQGNRAIVKTTGWFVGLFTGFELGASIGGGLLLSDGRSVRDQEGHADTWSVSAVSVGGLDFSWGLSTNSAGVPVNTLTALKSVGIQGGLVPGGAETEVIYFGTRQAGWPQDEWERTFIENMQLTAALLPAPFVPPV